MEQVKGTPELQERIIASYREARSDRELAEQLLMSVVCDGGGETAGGTGGGTTSTSTIYENYLDGLHVEAGTTSFFHLFRNFRSLKKVESFFFFILEFR